MNITKILDEAIAPALPATLDVVATVCLDGVTGAVVPGVGNMLLAYQQKQQEKRFNQALVELKNRQEEIDSILKNYEEELKPLIEKMLDIYFQYSLKNSQEEKVKYLGNGYVNSISVERPQEDVILGFYDTLDQVNILDIRVLKLYCGDVFEVRDNYEKVMEDFGIDYSQYKMIRLKLERLGLLESKNDIKQDENIGYIIDYLNAQSKNKISDAKRTLGKMKKIPNGETFKVTKYGINFMRFIYC